MITAIGILLASGFIIAAVEYDALKLNKGDYLSHHKARALFRCAIFLLFWIHSIYWVVAAGLLFTALFDQLLNFRRRPKRDFWYLGTEAKWDRFFSRKYFSITYPLLERINKKRVWRMVLIDFNFKILYIFVKVFSLLASLFLFFELWT